MKLILHCLAIAVLATLVGCSVDEQPANNVTQAESGNAEVTQQADGKVTQTEYGARWPFTVPEGIIDCVSRADVVLRVGEDVYAINGTARGKAKPGGEYKDLAEIWRDQTADVGGKVPVPDELTQKGLKICEAKAGT